MKDLYAKVSKKAVIIGALVNIVGTNIWGVVMITYVVSAYGLSGVPANELKDALTSVIEGSVPLKSLNWIVGGAFSVLGGYVAARIAKQHVLLNAALSSFLCVAFVLYGILSGAASANILLAIFALPVNVFLSWLGGLIHQKTERVQA